jgi:N-acetylneuraminic acid mutarotase
LQAAASTGIGENFVIFGGNDGTSSIAMRELHPGFQREVLIYDASRKAWRVQGEMPVSLVTTGSVRFGNGIVIPGGEDRPGSRSARVISMDMLSR